MGFVKEALTGAVDFLKSEVLPVIPELRKAAGVLAPQEAHGWEPKTSLVDPQSFNFMSYGYKEKFSFLDYTKLRSISYADPIISAIIQTRTNQVASFATPQADKYKVGFKIKMRDTKAHGSRASDKRAKDLGIFVMNCGFPESFDDTVERRKRDMFETFLRKITRDSLTFDQINFEVTPRRNGLPAEFIAVDAATIRLIADAKERQDVNYGHKDGSLIDYADVMPLAPSPVEHKTKVPRLCQVIRGVIQHTYEEWEMALGVRNPRTDILANGYGFCLHPDSRVATTRGMVRVSELAEHGDTFQIVLDGKSVNAKAYTTGVKRVFEMQLGDGRTLRASPDHRIYTVDDDGGFEWKRLGDIRSGDTVLCDLVGQPGGVNNFSFDFSPGDKQRSKPWSIRTSDSDIWEVLGWLVGDGNFRERFGDQKGLAISLFYEKKTEEHIMRRHLDTLAKYDLNPGIYEGRGDLFEVKFNHQGFGEWLKSLGFIVSNGWVKPNCLPEIAFFLNERDRASFLRGLFSADGHLGASDTPVLGCTDLGLLQDTQRLLWSLGIRSKYRHGQVPKDFGQGAKIYDDGGLWVYDKLQFFEKIGFIQDHKQPVLDEYQGTRADTVSGGFARRVAQEIKDGGLCDRRIRGLLEDIPRWGVTRSWLKARLPASSSLHSDLKWHQEKVVSVTDTGEEVEMCDLSVEDDFHGFTVDGVVVHNSEIEMLIQTVTAHMNAETYNRRFFSQGSAIKGVLTFEGSVPPDQLEAFRRQWHQQVSGVNNAWKTPILGLGKESKINWVNLHSTNREMEWGKYMEYLIKSICGVFQIDPIEIGFDISRNPSGQGGGLGMGAGFAWERLQYSMDKGLAPLLRFIANLLNEYVIWRIDPDFEFEFVGLDARDEKDDLDIADKQVKSFKTVNELRAENDLPPIKDAKDIKSPGDLILDSNFLQMVQGASAPDAGGMGGPDGQQPGGDQGEEPDYESMGTDELQQELAKLQGQGGGKPATPDRQGASGMGAPEQKRSSESPGVKQATVTKSLELLL